MKIDVPLLFKRFCRNDNHNISVTNQMWRFIHRTPIVHRNIQSKHTNGAAAVSTTRFVNDNFMHILYESRSYEEDHCDLHLQLETLCASIEVLLDIIIDVMESTHEAPIDDTAFLLIQDNPELLIPTGVASNLDVFTPFYTGGGIYLVDSRSCCGEDTTWAT